ncbi:hypothetical protein MMC11_001654 [Xylographa trunciseda]|nr:hypothetical protein [Xylographa trunciseda]
MDQAIAQALRNLLPSQNGDMPSELNELALALLAQSRSLAGNLKAEEEIARSYACAHLACSRLKRPLDLPKIDPRPPCLPRVYQSLYRYFDISLRAGTRRRGRPPKTRDEDSRHSAGSLLAATPTEVWSSVQEEFAPEYSSQIANRPHKTFHLRSRQDGTHAPTKIPDWVMPAIHRLCRSTGAVAAPPHVFVGMVTGIELFSKLQMTGELNNKTFAGPESLLALLVAVYLYVTFRSSGGQVTALRLEAEAKNAFEILARSDDEISDKPSAELQKVHGWIAAFQDTGFLEMDWIKNVPTAIATEHISEFTLRSTDEGLGIQRLRGETDESEGASTLLPGLGTMMQDKLNFITQAKRSEYADWKSRMMSHICELEEVEATVYDKTEVTGRDQRSRLHGGDVPTGYSSSGTSFSKQFLFYVGSENTEGKLSRFANDGRSSKGSNGMFLARDFDFMSFRVCYLLKPLYILIERRDMVRIAVEGCGHGTLHAIYASIAKSCEINGWDDVDLLIIGGDFQAVRNSYDLNCMSVPAKFREIGDFHEYYSGQRRAPYLTIFVGGNHEASNHLFELYYGGWVAPNIYYLGAANVLRFGPLRIAGLSGIWKGYNYNKVHHERLPYNQDDVKSVYHVREFDVRKLLQVRTQVDIGISHDWPRGIEWMGNWKALFAKKDLFEADARAGTLGSSAAKYVMDRLRPPHWFAAHLHCKFSALVNHKLVNHHDLSSTEPAVQQTASLAGESTANANQPSLEKALLAGQLSSVQLNSDEIDLDMDLDDEVQLSDKPRTALLQGQYQQATSLQDDGPTVREDLRAQLPASFSRPVQALPIATVPAPEGITNTTTKFLALDKCLPHRKFLQILEIEPADGAISPEFSKPYALAYDKEWLAITRVSAADLVVGNASLPIPPNRGEEYYRLLIEKEEHWVEENLPRQGGMAVPLNFEVTAPVYDANVGVGTKEQPKEYTNPQTVQFCNMLGIPNPFHLSEEEREARILAGPTAEASRMGGGRGRRQDFRRGNRWGGRGGRDGGRGRGRGAW